MSRGAGAPKRSSEEADVNSDSDVESQRRRIKRARQSTQNGHANGHDVEMGDDSDEEESDVERDDSDLESEWECGFDLTDMQQNQRAAQIVQAEREAQGSVIPEAGIIKGVKLINFMNHRNFSYDRFGVKLNFIVGPNGSGKSALLTAVATALGARALYTGRGNGVKDMISRNANKATIILTLRNSGPYAYRPEVYGNEIIIERWIDRRASGYKIKTANGDIVDTKRTELDNICGHFSINVESPMTLLTQDMGKNWLATSEPKKLYDLFLTSTGLRKLVDQYQDASTETAKLKIIIEHSKVNLPHVKEQLKKLERLHQAAQKTTVHQKELDLLSLKLGWSFVKDHEKNVASHETSLAEQQTKITRLTKSIDADRAEWAKYNSKMDDLQAEIQRLQAESTPDRRTLEDLVATRHLRANQLKTDKSSLTDMEEEIEALTRRIQEYDREIAARDAIGDGETQQQKNIRSSIERLKVMQRNMNEQKFTSKRNIPQLENEVKESDITLNRAEQRLRDASDQLHEAKRRYDNLAQQRTDPLVAFGPHVRHILREIENTHWDRRPLGPIGQYVKLKDMRFKGVAESLLSRTLCAFAVTTQRDMNKLSTICRRISTVNRQSMPTILLRKAENFDFSSGDLSHRAPTMLSILEVSNPEALRLLIDADRIERIFATPTQREATALINEQLANGLDNVIVVSADGFNQTGRPGSIVSGPISRWQGNALLSRDTTQELATVEADITRLTEQRRTVHNEVQTLRGTKRDAERKLATAKADLQTSENGLRETTRKVAEYEDQLEAIQPLTGDALQQAKSECEAELDSVREDRDKTVQLISSRATEIEEISSAIQQLEAKIDKTKPKITHCKGAVTSMAGRKMQLDQNIKHHEGRLQKAKDDFADIQGKRDARKREVEQWTAFAADRCERFDFPETTEQIKARMNSLKTLIDEANRSNNSNPEECARKYNEATKQYKDMKLRTKENANLLGAFQSFVSARRKRWRSITEHCSTRVTTSLLFNLASRGYAGKAVFDHTRDLLTFTVSHQTPDGQMTRPKTIDCLSGGERSYTTVCLLAALWTETGNTIACLDEWDVFMDSVNRKEAGRMLIRAARAMGSKQFLLLTPLNISGIDLDPQHDRMIQMSVPDPDQNTLVGGEE